MATRIAEGPGRGEGADHRPARGRGGEERARGNAKPSFMLKLSRADRLIVQGMDLDVGWIPSLITGARNPQIQPGQKGNLDASTAITPIEVPTGVLNRSLGDLHTQGNPHDMVDPENGRKVARLIEPKLEQLDPQHAGDFQQGLATFRCVPGGRPLRGQGAHGTDTSGADEGIDVYLGIHVLRRGVIFVDLALTQVAASGGSSSWCRPTRWKRRSMASRSRCGTCFST